MTPADRLAMGIGQTFTDYRIDELAGRQRGVGRVYVATHLESERHLEFPPWPVALKVFTPPEGQEEEFRTRFEAAAKLQAGLHNPNVVSVYEVGSEPLPFMSMTLFRGPTLADLIASRSIDEPAILPIVDSVAAALDGGLERGLPYRRLRPGGILVATDAQRAFLGDFGVGRATRINDLLDNEELGTFVDYISPEEARSAEVSASSLVYSLASIVFECLTGEPPYPHQEGDRSLQLRLEEPPRKVRELRPDLPGGLESVLVRALDSEPKRRPASPGELAKAVRDAYPKHRRRAPRLRATTTIAKTPPLTAEPTTEAEKPRRRGLRRRGSGAAATTAGAAAAVTAAEATEAPTEQTEASARAEAPTAVPVPAAKPQPRKPEPPTPEEPATAEEPRRKREDRPRRRALAPALLLVALLVAGAAVLGAVVAPNPKADTTKTPPRNLKAGSASFQYPADWTRKSDDAAIDGVNFKDAVAIAAPGAGAGRALVAGHAPLDSLPAGDASRAVDLGAVQAYRHEDVNAGSGKANLYVVPTSGDAIAVACVAPSSTDAFLGRCERVASTLKLSGGDTAVALAPSPAYARDMRRIVARLDVARRSERSALQSARSRGAQSANATKLATTYAAAATAVKRVASPPGARKVHARIQAALTGASKGYRGMASAARRGSGGAWTSSRNAATSAENDLQDALNGLRELGYQPRAGS